MIAGAGSSLQQRIDNREAIRSHRLLPKAKPEARTPVHHNLALRCQRLAEIELLLFQRVFSRNHRQADGRVLANFNAVALLQL